jgi:concentrative nucleoside transporter, CNT family
MTSVLMSLLGLIIFIGICYLLSENRKAIKWRTVIAGLILNALIALFVLKVPFGQKALEAVSNGFQKVVSYSNEGIMFLFGGLYDKNTTFVFAINVLLSIVFFSALMSVLYYLGVMQFIIRVIGGFIGKILGTSKAETFSAVADIFVGQTEAPLVVKPFLQKMTKSEIFGIMVAGTASMAGSVLVGYSMMGIPMKWLILACFMVATSALIVAKIMIPETEEATNEEIHIDGKQGATNIFDAIALGTTNGVKLAVNVAGMLLSFISLVALVNGILGIFGITLQEILGYLFYPIALLMGVSTHDAMLVGQFLGTKFVVNEFVAYSDMAKHLADLSERSIAIATVAIGGFANLSSIGILLGGYAVLVPERRALIAKLGFKAIVAGMIANIISAVIVGLFI